MKLIECVPNFSEGRDAAVIAAVRSAAESVPGAHVLDLTSDPWHHRSVLTMAGTPEAMLEAAFAVVREAARGIDLRTHEGEHPRIGAADVVPFIPLEGATMEDCVALARMLGERIGRELEIPVYLYEEAATRPERRDLATVRRGGFEGLRDATVAGASPPDFGPGRLHESAGAVAVGARPILVAFNVFLGDASQLGTVREIARTVRASSGGLPGVKALAFVVNGQAQLSMNLTDLDRTPAHVAYDTVLSEAERRGLVPAGSELIGLTPERVLLQAGVHALGLPATAATQTLEGRLRRAGLPGSGKVVTAGHVDRSTPFTAGAAAALSAALGARLGADLAESGEARTAALATRFRQLGERLESLAPVDVTAFDALRSAEAIPPDGLPAGDREAVLAAAIAGASAIPLEIARAASEVSQLLLEGADNMVPHALANAHAAAVLSHGACRASVELIRSNVHRLPEPASGRGLLEAAEEFAGRARTAEKSLERLLSELG